MAEPVPDRTSQLEYFCDINSNFCVLADQATIIGVRDTNQNTIVKENLTDQSALVVTYTANIGFVYTLAVDEPKNMLFAGSSNDFNGQVVQYDLSTGRALKNYCQVAIGAILSITRLDKLCLLGGCGTSKFAVIDATTRQIAHEPVTTAIREIFSMTVCNLQRAQKNSKVLLLVAGESQNYSNGRTDVIDITGLVNEHSISPGDC